MSRGDGVASHRKLMDWQAPAAPCGPILGILATTYELDPSFVEMDLLPAVLGLGAWDDRSWSSRVALEHSLARLEATSILVDQRKYRGRPRSLRVEVLPAVGDGGQKLHAKLLLIVHEHAVRLQVASANLTESGYRENREVALPLVASSNAGASAALVLEAVETMPAVLGPWWTDSADVVLGLAQEKLREWSPGAAPDATFVWGGTSKPLWEQVLDKWPVGDQVERISIVSPFWSEEGRRGPFTILVEELRRRQALAEKAAVDLYTEAEPATQRTFRPKMPPVGLIDPKALGVRLTARAVQPNPSDEPNMDDVLKVRKLHAKVLLLQGSKTTLGFVGSANFTAAGWGFTARATSANVEAGIILVRRGAALVAALLPPTTGKAIELDGTNTAATCVEEEPQGAVPTFVRGVWLEPEPANQELLRLSIRIDPRRVAGAFDVSSAGDQHVGFMRGDQSSAEETHVALDGDGVALLVREQHVSIRWWESDVPCDYPVNVDLAARANLPAVPGNPNPSEQLLLAYYQGRISFTDLFPPPPGWEDDLELVRLEPTQRSGVDTSRIQSYQVREFVEALQGIRDDLTAASKGTDATMRLAVSGPVSPVALAKEVRDAARAGKRGATAAGFQLVEIATCLKEASRSEGVKPAWPRLLDEGRRTVEAILAQLPRSAAAEGRFSGVRAAQRS